ncbi:hypothetical protein [Clostridium sp.]|uniref:hypothetical protein n=1 Tax=Clostridium sp. TaxID=1506 RepID=UPI002FC61BD5
MDKLVDLNLKRNLVEFESTLRGEEEMEGYFVAENITAAKERKSPIRGENIFGYLFVDEWIWNTIFILTNKKLYLINTRENFEKISLNTVTLDDLESMNVEVYDDDTLISLKLRKYPEVQYKPTSDNNLDIIKKIPGVNIIEKNKNIEVKSDNKAIVAYAIGAIIAVALIVILYIFL